MTRFLGESNMIYIVKRKPPEILAHHGILGMSWGKRNGPPYPLGASDHSAKEKAAGTKGWSKEAKSQSRNSSGRKGLTSGQKKVLAVGAGVALAAIGGYALYKSGALDNVIAKYRRAGFKSINNTNFHGIGAKRLAELRQGMLDPRFRKGTSSQVTNALHKTALKSQEVKDIMTNNTRSLYQGGSLIESNSNGLAKFNKISSNISTQNALKGANPFFKSLNPFTNSQTIEVLATNFNCGNSVLAFEGRKRGFDVMALGNHKGLNLNTMLSVFDDIPAGTIITPKMPKSITSTIKAANRGSIVKQTISDSIMKSYPNNARGFISLPMKDGGHYMVFEKRNGTVEIFDTQNYKRDVVKVLDKYYHHNDAAISTTGIGEFALSIVRTDHLSINDGIENFVTNTGKSLKMMNDENFKRARTILL